MLGTLTDEEIDRLLHEETVGRIGVSDDVKTYVVPVSYVYDGTSIYVHSYDGEKLRMLRANPAVCFEIDRVEHLSSWRSVIAWGRYEELMGDLATGAMNLLAWRLREEVPSETAGPQGPHGREPGTAFRIRITEKTGRFEQP